MTGYNGWTNRDTWLVPLWVDNDYGTYIAKCALLESRSEKIDWAIAEYMADELGVNTIITDEWDRSKVDWTEIAEAWETERLELIALS
jgi:16S rRNA U1498 N3-methylase RsmE